MFFRVVNINDFSDIEIHAALSDMPLNQQEYIRNKKQILSRKQSIVSRILLKELLFENFDITDGYNIDFKASGKPFYANSKDVHFSISHSGDFVGVVVSNKPVGIDIQVDKSVNEKLMEKVCTKEEMNYLENVSKREFIKLWTVKEAYSKCSEISLFDVFKLSFVKDGSICGLDKTLHCFTNGLYELSIIE